MNQPVRVCIRLKNGGTRTYYGSYALIKKYQDQGRLIRAWSTSAGKLLA